MTATLKRSRKERLQDSTSCLMVDKPARHHAHIGIVVLTGQTSNFLNPTKGGSYPLVLVQSNVNTIATSANRHSGIALAFFNGNGQRVSKIGIITTLSRISSKITIGNAPVGQPGSDKLFQLIAGMVTGQTHRDTGFQNTHNQDFLIVPTKIFSAILSFTKVDDNTHITKKNDILSQITGNREDLIPP